jgi:hypothetical protein
MGGFLKLEDFLKIQKITHPGGGARRRCPRLIRSPRRVRSLCGLVNRFNSILNPTKRRTKLDEKFLKKLDFVFALKWTQIGDVGFSH